MLNRFVVRVTIVVMLCFIAGACNPMQPDNPVSIPSLAPPTNLLTRTDLKQSPTNDKYPGNVAYLSDRSDFVELWLYDIELSDSRQLTASDCTDQGASHGSFKPGVQFFTWSPNGQRIAYAVTCSFYGRTKILILDLETGKTAMVGIGDRYSSYPSWSPDGTRFVFGRGVPGFSDGKEQGIYRVNLQKNGDSIAGKIEQIISEEYCYHGCLYTTWSPDGRYIAYQGARVPAVQVSRNPASIADAEQYLSDNQPATPIEHSIGIHDLSPHGLAWSPNSQLLAIATPHSYSNAYLTVVSINDPTKSRFYLHESSVNSPNLFGPGFYTPVFSPDSAALYFVANPVDATGDWPGPFGVIYRVPLSVDPKNPTKDVQAVSEEGQLAGFPSLSHNGKWLAYTVLTGATSEIWLQTLDGQARQKMVGDGYLNTQPAWQPSK